MGEKAGAAILYLSAVFPLPIDGMPRAVRVGVHRAIAEQAVEVLPRLTRVAGEIFASFILKITMAVSHVDSPFKCIHFPYIIILSYHLRFSHPRRCQLQFTSLDISE
jgi:hypothetical protein